MLQFAAMTAGSLEGEGPELCLQGVVGLALCPVNKEGAC